MPGGKTKAVPSAWMGMDNIPAAYRLPPEQAVDPRQLPVEPTDPLASTPAEDAAYEQAMRPSATPTPRQQPKPSPTPEMDEAGNPMGQSTYPSGPSNSPQAQIPNYQQTQYQDDTPPSGGYVSGIKPKGQIIDPAAAAQFSLRRRR